MTNKKLRHALLNEIDHLQKNPPTTNPLTQARVLGKFVDAALTNTGRTRGELAQQLGMEDELMDALCEGELPEDIISDETLVEIAAAINHAPNLLRTMLGRQIAPTLDEESAKK